MFCAEDVKKDDWLTFVIGDRGNCVVSKPADWPEQWPCGAALHDAKKDSFVVVDSSSVSHARWLKEYEAYAAEHEQRLFSDEFFVFLLSKIWGSEY